MKTKLSISDFELLYPEGSLVKSSSSGLEFTVKYPLYFNKYGDVYSGNRYRIYDSLSNYFSDILVRSSFRQPFEESPYLSYKADKIDAESLFNKLVDNITESYPEGSVFVSAYSQDERVSSGEFGYATGSGDFFSIYSKHTHGSVFYNGEYAKIIEDNTISLPTYVDKSAFKSGLVVDSDPCAIHVGVEYAENYNPEKPTLNNTDDRVFESGSRRDNSDNKYNPRDIHPYALMRYGAWMKLGEISYGKGNWQLGQPNEAIADSLTRHINALNLKLIDPKMFDKIDAGTDDHICAAIFGLQMLLMNEGREGIDFMKYFNIGLPAAKEKQRKRLEGEF